MLTIYSKNNCPQCKMVKRWLDNKNVEYNEINIEENPSFIQEVKDLGYSAVPVIKYKDVHFQGFAIPKLQNVVSLISN
jgi:glutaredoxin-like protein NrdH